MFERDRQLSPLQMMLIMNAFSAVFSFVTVTLATPPYPNSCVFLLPVTCNL